jgi:hypothetical protein
VFLGVGGCDLAAIATLGRVLGEGSYPDGSFIDRHRRLFVAAVNCTEPGGLCLCVSMGTGPVGLGDAEVGEQQRHRLGGHRGAAIGVDGQLIGSDALLGAGLADQHLGQSCGFAGSDHPTDHVPRKDVQDDIGSSTSASRGRAAW